MNAQVLADLMSGDYDAVTGLPNDGYFNGLLQETWMAWEGASVSLVGFDVARFDRFVEQYGRDTGDECLKRISRVAEGVLSSPGCRMARYGSQRFLILLPGFGADEARLIAQELQTQITALELGITLSVTVVSETARRRRSVDALLASALDALDATR